MFQTVDGDHRDDARGDGKQVKGNGFASSVCADQRVLEIHKCKQCLALMNLSYVSRPHTAGRDVARPSTLWSLVPAGRQFPGMALRMVSHYEVSRRLSRR